MPPVARKTIKESSRANYVKAMNRLISAAEARAALLKADPKLIDIAKVIAIRSHVLSTASTNMEIHSLRWAITTMSENGVPSMDYWEWPEGVHAAPWMQGSAGEWAEFEAIAALSCQGMRDAAPSFIDQDRHIAETLGLDSSDEELLQQTANVMVNPNIRLSQRDLKTITHRDLMLIEMNLSHLDPLQAVQSIRSEKETDFPGLTRVFANTIWMTGMRPAEMWSCYLMVPRTDIVFTEEMRALAVMNPQKAITDKLYTRIEKVYSAMNESLGGAVLAAMDNSGAPAILAIRSSKQTNANPIIKGGVRLQIINRMPIQMMTVLAAATQLRGLGVDDRVKDLVRRSIIRHLKVIGETEPALRGFNLNLYAMRHAFATRVRAHYKSHEAAALTGHSSESSLGVYGRRRASTARKASTGTGWLPQPDPVLAETIKLAWAMKKLKPDLQPAPENG